MQSYSTLKALTTSATVSSLKPGTRYVFQVEPAPRPAAARQPGHGGGSRETP